MNNLMNGFVIAGLVSVLGLASCGTVAAPSGSSDAESSSLVGASAPETERSSTMELGAFSVSLAVKDLATSRAFYESLGFEQIAGEAAQNWLILRNGTTVIGLFQGMFEENILTFNPGWSQKKEDLAEFTDVREIQRRLDATGIELQTRADESTTGPASCVLKDPDGNTILIDQHR